MLRRLEFMVPQPVPTLRSTYTSYSKFLSQLRQTKSANEGLQIHAQLVKLGLSQDPKHRNHLISLYAKCRVFSNARKLLEESPESDLVSLSSLISGYAQNGLGGKALLVFHEMHALGIKGKEFTFPSVLKACANTPNFTLGKQVQIVVVAGFESDVFVANTLVLMYAKCGSIIDSRSLFEDIPERNVVSWNALITCYTQSDLFGKAMGLFPEMIASGIRPDDYSLSTVLNAATGLEDICEGKKIHGYLIKLGYEDDPFSANALVDMYAKAGDLGDALTVFRNVPKPDIVSWNALIAGCVSHKHHVLALELLDRMRMSGIDPNLFTMSSALKACAALGANELGKQFHAKLIKMEKLKDHFVNVGLIDMYSKCRLMKNAVTVYSLIPEKKLVATNALISGFSVCWEIHEALILFQNMHKQSMEFNHATLLVVLNALANLEAMILCKKVHALIMKSGYHADNFIMETVDRFMMQLEFLKNAQVWIYHLIHL